MNTPLQVSDLACGPVTRNAVIRRLEHNAADLRRHCVCEVMNIKNLGPRRAYELQQALEAKGLTLAPCRTVWREIEYAPGLTYRRPAHHVLLDDVWKSPSCESCVDRGRCILHPDTPVTWAEVPDQDAGDDPVMYGLDWLKERAGR